MTHHSVTARPRAEAALKLSTLASASACLLLLLSLNTAMNGQTANESSATGSGITVTHIMGLSGVANNTNGKLSIAGDSLQFEPTSKAASQVGIASIQDIVVGEEDRQVGGVPMMLGKAAIPYSGGRFISLFSHKKYDSLTVEYVDGNGGLHGAIFRIAKGQGVELRKELAAKGAHVTVAPDDQSKPATQEVKNESK
jgi:hypothetical protein